jgi:hypothetical protein
MNSYDALFEEIGRALTGRFSELSLPIRIIGRAALELAGLPERGTKDVDALEEFMRVDTLSGNRLSDIEAFLKGEFGKGSPGDRKHGLYLDLVEKGIAWLPPRPLFIDEKRYSAIVVRRLHPADVCVSKTFSNFRRKGERGRDRTDIFDSLDAGLFEASDYIRRLDEALPVYEVNAEAPEMFPRVIRFVEEEILPRYGEGKVRLNYAVPAWMENMR